MAHNPPGEGHVGAAIEPDGYDMKIGMTISLDRAEAVRTYIDLVLAEMTPGNVIQEKLIRQYLVNARYLLMTGKKL